MDFFNPQPESSLNVLATDLDGTWLPLPGNPDHLDALCVLRDAIKSSGHTLIYATGRHLESVEEAIEMVDLPFPDWLVCDVGSRILSGDKQRFEEFALYSEHLQTLSKGYNRGDVEDLLAGITGMRLQIPDHQTSFKISYECDSDELQDVLAATQEALETVPYACTGSLDPFLHCGLIDVMPEGVSKAYALTWLATHADFIPNEVIYAGDSGNDLSALACGFHAIVVGNASPGLAEQVRGLQQERGITDRLVCAKAHATSGVLEGCRAYGFASPTESSSDL